MANFTPMCDNACLQPPTGERGEATKREVLFVGTDQVVLENELTCGWLSERGRHSKRPGPARASLVQIQPGFLSGFCSDSQKESAGF